MVKPVTRFPWSLEASVSHDQAGKFERITFEPNGRFELKTIYYHHRYVGQCCCVTECHKKKLDFLATREPIVKPARLAFDAQKPRIYAICRPVTLFTRVSRNLYKYKRSAIVRESNVAMIIVYRLKSKSVCRPAPNPAFWYRILRETLKHQTRDLDA